MKYDTALVAGRLDVELLERFLSFADRVMDVVEELDKQRRSRRIIDQLAGAGTSPMAQAFEANEALSAADFAKTIGIASKELSETCCWLLLIDRRGWLKSGKLDCLLDEAGQLLRITKSMKARTRGKRKA